ncbi:MAG: thiamine pyrophosphate-binding protein, partial [candidate division Zixibacteria bacterium]|nr:thiamine pyrophosphate-binding protein [candidate division Zixibacteria bacterium]
MKDSIGLYNQYFCRLMIEELVRSGVDYFCLSPGARSTPLTVAVAENPTVSKQLFHDERAAAFHALGYARAGGKPAALICTSGTAAA